MTLSVSPAEAAYVRQGRALFTTLFRGCGYDFEAPRWDIRHLRTSQHKKSNAQVHFTIYGSQVDPLPPRFANIVKAYVLLNKGAAETMDLRVGSARMLWMAILQRFGDAEAFDWSLLIEDDLSQDVEGSFQGGTIKLGSAGSTEFQLSEIEGESQLRGRRSRADP